MPILSALIAGFVAVVVSRRTHVSAREQWLYGKRFETYAAFWAATAKYNRSEWVKGAVELKSDIQRAVFAVDLVCPHSIGTLSLAFSEALHALDAQKPETEQTYIHAMSELLLAMKSDLVPKRML